MTALGVYLPSPRYAARVWQREAIVFSKVWKNALLPQFFDPLFYLLALGFGLGTYLTHVQGIPYKQFIAAGLVASSVMWAASFESTWNAFFKMEEQRLFDAILTTPVQVQDVLVGEVAWAATRAVIYGTTFLVIVTAFGLVRSAWAIAIPPFLAIGGACFAMMGMTFTSLSPRLEFFSFYFTLFITPLFLFSGIFYPLDKLPDWVSTVAWFSPLYHLVQITRPLVLGPHFWPIVGNAAWLIGLTAALYAIPVRAMRRRLIS